MAGYLSSWKDDEMLKLSDSGCRLHGARQLTLGGITGAIIRRLVTNLPVEGQRYIYICEYGHTHTVRLQQPGETVLSPCHY
ncbi:MAG: hypothetical protein WC443_08375 [Desulfobaccales bacterium]